MLDEQNIPVELLPKARAWFDRQMQNLEQKHGAKWPEHRAWLVEYLNQELLEYVAKREGTHG